MICKRISSRMVDSIVGFDTTRVILVNSHRLLSAVMYVRGEDMVVAMERGERMMMMMV